MKAFLIMICLLCMQDVSAQDESIRYHIPKDYDTLYGGFAKGDLNKDGIDDVTLALFHKMEKDESNNDEDSIPSRVLLILFGTKNGYVESVSSLSVLMCKNCGGIFGDPFAGISITRNVLSIAHYGGSAWRWARTHKFRFQENGWYLIGQTNISYWNAEFCDKLNDFAGTDYEDVNLLTGQFEIKRISEDCKLLESKNGKKAVQPLTSLTNFNIDN